MKELRNNVDTEVAFTDLQKAKNWYLPEENVPCSKEEYLGDDYEEFCKGFAEYKQEIQGAGTLEELADVLNRYSGTYDDGREYTVVFFDK